MEKYIEEIPLVVKNSIKALCDENRQGILIYLLRSGAKSFTEITKELKIPKNNLSHHIKTLMRYGLIYNFYNRNEFADKYSFYEISKLGRRVIDSLINIIPPISPMKKDIFVESILNAGNPSDLSKSEWIRVWTAKRKIKPLSPVSASTVSIDEEISQKFSPKKKTISLHIS